MNEFLAGLKPERLWKHFAKILEIPHCSGNEKGLADYVISVAKAAGLAWKKDAVGNVCVSKPASAGRDKAPGIILQGHLDMVCEKNSDIAHDFRKEAIVAELAGPWVQAKGTTLGADNGIGLSAALAIMEDMTLVHGPLEFLFTVDEETGLTGATKIEPGFLKGTRLLNLDSEEEGTFTIGCAGGADTVITLPLKRKTASRSKGLYQLKIFGLQGGHSGLDINKGRANAIKLLARMLWKAQAKFGFEAVRVEAGSKRNAIPREALADLLMDPKNAEALAAFFQVEFGHIQTEFKSVEKEAQFLFEKKKGAAKPLAPASQKSLLNLLLGLPHGVAAMHPEIAGLVETSTNLAIVSTKESSAQVVCSTRSSIGSALQALRDVIRAVADLVQARVSQPSGYPGWTPNLQSDLLKKLKGIHVKVFNKEAEVVAVHAGLECGIIGEKFPGMDMISFGPTIQFPHSPKEHVEVRSVENFWKFLTSVLQALN